MVSRRGFDFSDTPVQFIGMCCSFAMCRMTLSSSYSILQRRSWYHDIFSQSSMSTAAEPLASRREIVAAAVTVAAATGTTGSAQAHQAGASTFTILCDDRGGIVCVRLQLNQLGCQSARMIGVARPQR